METKGTEMTFPISASEAEAPILVRLTQHALTQRFAVHDGFAINSKLDAQSFRKRRLFPKLETTVLLS